jgi:hypothetical protein
LHPPVVRGGERMETRSVAAPSASNYRQTATRAVDPLRPACLHIDAEMFRDALNRHAFLVGHTLGDHPLFALARLIDLSRRLPPQCVVYNAGDVSVADGLYKGPRNGLPVEETIQRIEECRSWMVLKSVETDVEYRALLDACLDQVHRLAGQIVPTMRKRGGFIFISSPRSITPFHMDPEYNFLLQIRGTKTIQVFEPDDRTVISEEDLERFYAANGDNANIRFKDAYRRRAKAFELSPGVGLHIPVTAPHWVENGDAVSISFSITFETSASERRSLVYAANARLRRMGVHPAPFGRSALTDAAKFYGVRALRRARRILPIGDTPVGPAR